MSQGRTRRGTVSLPGRGSAASVVDELRAVPMVPDTTTTTPATPATPAVAPAPAPVAPAPVPVEPPASGVAPLPPPKRRGPAREQFSTKLPPQLIQDLRAFSDHHEAEIQVVVELALTEYLTSRGWGTGA